jgi:hypothetical protein
MNPECMALQAVCLRCGPCKSEFLEGPARLDAA